jgi:hypothetical protein
VAVPAGSISASDVIVRIDGHVSAPLGGDLAMMNVESGSFYLLDDIAAAVWAHLAEPKSVSGLVAELGTSYDVEPERCEAELLPFLSRLHDRGLIRVDP